VDKEEDHLSYRVIGAAMQVHRELGPGVNEGFHHQRLSELLHNAGIAHLSKPRGSLFHHGFLADVFEPDMVLPGHLVLELKRLQGEFARAHFVQLKAYLKHWHIPHGLLFDFGKESLVVKRYVHQDTPAPHVDTERLLAGARLPPDGSDTAQGFCRAVAHVAAEFGLGYPDGTYRRLLEAELRGAGLEATSTVTTAVRVGQRLVGQTRLPCLTVGNAWGVMILSQRDGIRAADRAILQSWLRHLDRRWGVIAHFTKRTVECQWVLGSSMMNPDHAGLSHRD